MSFWREIEFIAGKVRAIRRRYDEADPFRLCRAMGIALLIEPMGRGDGACKGFYLRQSRQHVIAVNSDLPHGAARVVLAHEIGHAVLHSRLSGVRALHDFDLFGSASRLEYQANIFAAEYLIPDGDVLCLLAEGHAFFGVAQLLGVPPELLDYKFRAMKSRGHALPDPPVRASSAFFRKMPTDADSDTP